eukprot:7312671-Prymnesium_polylepis.1
MIVALAAAPVVARSLLVPLQSKRCGKRLDFLRLSIPHSSGEAYAKAHLGQLMERADFYGRA